MTKTVFKFYEINEEYEIDLFFRQFDCPGCNGHGEVYKDLADTTGEQYWEECDECGGFGVLYLRDCRPCKYCTTKIYFNQVGEKMWQPITAATDEVHQCRNSQSRLL